VEHIEDELKGAKEYAEKFVTCKVKGNTQWANRYKEMANDELKHAGYLHDKAVADIEEISKTYTPPTEMMDMWEHEHKEYVEQAALVKQMLSL
jgi:hypothetical protein